MPGGSKPETTALTQEIAAILRGAQGRAQKSNKEIAAAVDRGESYIGLLLKGRKQIDIELLDDICRFLEIDLVTQVLEPAITLSNAREYK